MGSKPQSLTRAAPWRRRGQRSRLATLWGGPAEAKISELRFDACTDLVTTVTQLPIAEIFAKRDVVIFSAGTRWGA